MKKIVNLLLLIPIFLLSACSHKEPLGTVLVGTIDGPETQLMQVAAKVAWERYKLKVKIVTFSDYNTPNIALSDGSIDANAFQHLPYLQQQMHDHGYKFVSAGKTFLFVMGAYSKKIRYITSIRKGAVIAIPNDPSNETRALLLLQSYNIIQLKKGVGLNATITDIVKNPLQVHFDELDAASLARVLPDVDLAVINSTYVRQAGLSFKDAVIRENTSSPYVNLIVVKATDKQSKKIKQLVQSYQSKPVALEAKKLFGDTAVPGWLVDD
jgi:D-methionine transport system substrate-binding protein